MKMNASSDDAVGVGYNFFNNRPLFMISDPPSPSCKEAS